MVCITILKFNGQIQSHVDQLIKDLKTNQFDIKTSEYINWRGGMARADGSISIGRLWKTSRPIENEAFTLRTNQGILSATA